MLRINLLLEDDFYITPLNISLYLPTTFVFCVSQCAEDNKQKILVDPLCEPQDERSWEKFQAADTSGLSKIFTKSVPLEALMDL